MRCADLTPTPGRRLSAWIKVSSELTSAMHGPTRVASGCQARRTEHSNRNVLQVREDCEHRPTTHHSRAVAHQNGSFLPPGRPGMPAVILPSFSCETSSALRTAA